MAVLAEGRTLHGVGLGGTGANLLVRGRQIFQDLAGFILNKWGSPARRSGCVSRRRQT